MEKKGKKNFLLICGIALTILIYLFLSILNCNIFTEKIKIGINIASMAAFYFLLTNIVFDAMFDPKIFKKSYSITFQIFFSLLPIGLFGQYIRFNKLWICLFTLIITIIISFCLCKKIKKININNVKELKFTNIVLITFFTILFPFLGMIKDIKDEKIINSIMKNIDNINEINIIDFKCILNILSDKVEVILFLICISPLLILQIIYEKILLDKELSNSE